MNRKAKGIRFEREIKNYLTSLDNYVIRQSSSLFPDLIIVDENGLHFAECKIGHLRQQDKNRAVRFLKRMVKKYPWLAGKVSFRIYTRGGVYFRKQ